MLLFTYKARKMPAQVLFNETRATNSHNNYRSTVNPSFVSPRRGKTSRHKADRFSRLIHLVEVNKHCVPYLFSAQLMRGTLCPLSRAHPPLSSFSSSSFQPYVPFSPSLLLPPAHRFPQTSSTFYPRRLWCFP